MPKGGRGGVMAESPVLGELARRVRALRDEQGLTQRMLAERSGVSPRYLAQLEAGEANISLERLTDVANALNTTLSALLDPRGGRLRAARGPEALALRAALDEQLDARDLAELKEVQRFIEARFAKRTSPVVA